MERRETGPLGAFPLRIPVGKLVAFCLGVAFAPFWWTVGERQSAPLERFYEGRTGAVSKTAIACRPMANRF